VRLRLGPPRSEPWSSARPQGAIGHQGEFTQGLAVCQTDRRRPLRQGPIGFPTGWPLQSGWSDNVSADVERTPDSTSSSENLSQRPISRAPRRSSRAAEPRAKLSRRALRWALEGIVCQHLTVARVAEGLGVS
jgi:hypothetical protein